MTKLYTAAIACVLVLSLASNGLAGTSYAVNALSDRDEKPHSSQNDHDDDHSGSHITCPSQSFLVGPSGKGNSKILDVTYIVKNDEDSGIGGFWALDHFTEHLKVWQLSDGSFYALKKYDGLFVAPTGAPTPSGSSTQTESAFGDITGGYVATFTGEFAPGSHPTTGNIGTYNYGGTMQDILGAQQGAPNPYDWESDYFGSSVAGFNQPHWGWTYTLDHSLQSSTSVNQWCNYNAVDGGNSGDIKP